jgi:3-oxoacyl-[acyl-carrier protein] reductase
VVQFVGQVIERFGSIHALVNNAGVGGPSTSVIETSLEDFARVLAVNVAGTFLMCKHVAPHICREESGRIVNFGSIFGMQGVAGGASYCASKGAIALLTHSLALELAPRITVNTIAPGQIISDMYEEDQQNLAAQKGLSLEEQLEESRLTIPAKRQGEGSDIANSVAWLLSADSAYITGQTISVNGGVILT